MNNFKEWLIEPLKTRFKEENVAVRSLKQVNKNTFKWAYSRSETQLGIITVTDLEDGVIDFKISKQAEGDCYDAMELYLDTNRDGFASILPGYLDEAVIWALNEYLTVMGEYMISTKQPQILAISSLTSDLSGTVHVDHHVVMRLPDGSRTHFDLAIYPYDFEKSSYILEINNPQCVNSYSVRIPAALWTSSNRPSLLNEVLELGLELRLASELSRLRERRTSKIKNWIKEVDHE